MGDKLEAAETSDVAQQGAVVVTSCLLDAYLACPTKCYLLSVGEVPAGSEYTAWAAEREESYRLEGVRKLTSDTMEPDIASSAPSLWMNEGWHWALAKNVRAQGWEAHIALIRRITQARTAPQLVPISFVAANKLSGSDKTMAAFEAVALSKALGTKAGVAKIVHGQKGATFSVNAGAVSRALHRKVSDIASFLSTPSPPDLILNQHCPECGFQDRCKKDAVEKDDLSLLTHLTKKERARFRGKGIFTVSQLAYTFRPRRRSKRLAARPERYHHSLKALAIREQKIHVVGKPELRIEGTPIFLDVEGLPDRDFYYLIGVRVDKPDGTEHHALWADSAAEEKRIWEDFLGILSDTDQPTLLHYGSFEKTFLRKMCDRHGGPPEDSTIGKAIISSTNLLSVIYARIYFPTYSNGLKEIARFLGFPRTFVEGAHKQR